MTLSTGLLPFLVLLADQLKWNRWKVDTFVFHAYNANLDLKKKINPQCHLIWHFKVQLTVSPHFRDPAFSRFHFFLCFVSLIFKCYSQKLLNTWSTLELMNIIPINYFIFYQSAVKTSLVGLITAVLIGYTSFGETECKFWFDSLNPSSQIQYIRKLFWDSTNKIQNQFLDLKVGIWIFSKQYNSNFSLFRWIRCSN